MEQAEAVLVEQYPQLVRLAYVTLPVSLGRHTRVLLAHKAVQRALPRGGRGAAGAAAGRDSPGGPLAEVRVRVLRASLAPSGRSRLAAAALGWPPVPPFVWGLRLWPPAGGIDEVSQALAGVPGPVRAAFVLHRAAGLPGAAGALLLGGGGAAAPPRADRGAARAADRGAGGAPGRAFARLTSAAASEVYKRQVGARGISVGRPPVLPPPLPRPVLRSSSAPATSHTPHSHGRQRPPLGGLLTPLKMIMNGSIFAKSYKSSIR
ncbi:hypothetical protein DRB89_40410 [Streptomyces sp. ICC4]|nr:hypothetical protein DRB89_40410 [Streptomyces sp. ICC4]